MHFKSLVLTVILLALSAGCATKPPQNTGKPFVLQQEHLPTTRAFNPPPEPEPTDAFPPQEDWDQVVRRLGRPVSFDAVWNDVRDIPRFKDEFETTPAFEAKRSLALGRCNGRYLVAAEVDHRWISYDADREVLQVRTFALNESWPMDEEFLELFGPGSELARANIRVQYEPWENIGVDFDETIVSVTEASGRTVFGGQVAVTATEVVKRGLFERRPVRDRFSAVEDLWFEKNPRRLGEKPPVAIEIPMGVDRAKDLLDKKRLRAAFVFSPQFPYYATGTTRKSATIDSPTTRVSSLQYLIGDIQCVAIFDADGALLATRPTR